MLRGTEEISVSRETSCETSGTSLLLRLTGHICKDGNKQDLELTLEEARDEAKQALSDLNRRLLLSGSESAEGERRYHDSYVRQECLERGM